jgi:hypothetical protein
MRAFEFLSEDPVMKSRVLTRLQKTPDDSPIFPQVYKTLVGEPLTGRIRTYIEARGDADAQSAIDHLDKLIPTLGNTDEVKAFMSKFTKKPGQEKAYDFIKLDVAFPKDGMAAPAPLSNVVDDGFAKKLFDKLVDFKGKNDAGPGEAAMAIMSPNITYAQGATVEEFGRGGDLIVAGVGKVEVKGGGGGRLTPFKGIDQKGMAQALANFSLDKPETKKSQQDKARYDKAVEKAKAAGTPIPAPPAEAPKKQMAGVTPTFMSTSLPAGFPVEEFIRAACQAWFGGANAEELIKVAGTPAFSRVWLNACYNGYREFAGWQGVLFLSPGAYQYTVSGSQILDSNVKSMGYIYYPGTSQPREMCPQVIPATA